MKHGIDDNWLVCDVCGEWHNPEDGILCKHCNEIVDAEWAQIRFMELKREKLRIFKAFCCADSTLRINCAVDMRSEAEQQEAKILRSYVAGDAPKDEGW